MDARVLEGVRAYAARVVAEAADRPVPEDALQVMRVMAANMTTVDAQAAA
ncbi:hypothetical protein QNA24_30150 [Rhodococcus qingshengii]|nr:MULTISPECIES: hypothetical protein [Rhodococcus]MCD2099631.1 hypothetical protein [Rhodococcus rhodochrous]MCD2123999.1 hypothetical protein [Rhodococcus rhodochrous]MCQ4136568.1 hypothetical protein [Rhodococcus rhodochrous]MDJ0490646.1 hypothetical protein [Rhodococcus qingshengii]